MSVAPSVEVANLSVTYDGREVLRNISMTVAQGEIMVIIGGSGSGKSTFMRHLLGLELPKTGRVCLLGLDLTQQSQRELTELRRKIGVAFQSGALLSSLTVADNVMQPLREHTRLDENTMRIMMRMKLDFVSLTGSGHLMPAQLSGGMVKRAAIARAIIMDPRLLFLDEPSAGLDPVVSAELDQLILRTREATGMAVVVVTHELESAFTIADRIMVLDRGEVLVCDTVAKVRSHPNERVQALLSRRIEERGETQEEFMKTLSGEKSRLMRKGKTPG